MRKTYLKFQWISFVVNSTGREKSASGASRRPLTPVLDIHVTNGFIKTKYYNFRATIATVRIANAPPKKGAEWKDAIAPKTTRLRRFPVLWAAKLQFHAELPTTAGCYGSAWFKYFFYLQ